MTFLGTKWDQAQINPKKLLAQALHTTECSTWNISRILRTVGPATSKSSPENAEVPKIQRVTIDAMCSTWNIPDVYPHSFKQRPNILTPIPGWGERQTFAHRQTKSTSRYRDQSPTEDLPICKEGYRRKLAPPGRSPHPPEKIDARFRPSANSEPCSAQIDRYVPRGT